jgi:ParB family chromosome partitioning protein
MVYEQIVEYGFSVRKTEEIIRALNEEEPAAPPAPTGKKQAGKTNEFQLLKKHLSDFFQTKVAFQMNEKGTGKIMIPFTSPEDLERIIQLLDAIKK